MDQLLLTVKDAAKACAVSRAQIYNWARSRMIPAVRIGKCVRIPARELEAHIMRLAAETTHCPKAPADRPQQQPSKRKR